MKNFLKHIFWFMLPVMLGAILLFGISPDKEFPYRFVKGECNDKASWIYQRLCESPMTADVVFVGASQTACAVNDGMITARLQEFSGKEIYAASLGYCRGGRDIQYVMLKEILRNKNPELVVIEVTEDEPKKSHPVFPYLAETADLFGSAIFFNQRYFQSIWKGLVLRFEYLKWKLSGQKFTPLPLPSPFGYLPTDAVAGEELLNRNRDNWEKRLAKTKSELLREIEIRYSVYYLDKMIHLAEREGARVLFLYLRESGSRLRLPLLYNHYVSRGELITLPEALYNDLSCWSDATHFNDKGAKWASGVISDALIQRITADPVSEPE